VYERGFGRLGGGRKVAKRGFTTHTEHPDRRQRGDKKGKPTKGKGGGGIKNSAYLLKKKETEQRKGMALIHPGITVFHYRRARNERAEKREKKSRQGVALQGGQVRNYGGGQVLFSISTPMSHNQGKRRGKRSCKSGKDRKKDQRERGKNPQERDLGPGPGGPRTIGNRGKGRGSPGKNKTREKNLGTGRREDWKQLAQRGKIG